MLEHAPPPTSPGTFQHQIGLTVKLSKVSLDGRDLNRYGPTAARAHGEPGRKLRPTSLTLDIQPASLCRRLPRLW